MRGCMIHHHYITLSSSFAIRLSCLDLLFNDKERRIRKDSIVTHKDAKRIAEGLASLSFSCSSTMVLHAQHSQGNLDEKRGGRRMCFSHPRIASNNQRESEEEIKSGGEAMKKYDGDADNEWMSLSFLVLHSPFFSCHVLRSILVFIVLCCKTLCLMPLASQHFLSLRSASSCVGCIFRTTRRLQKKVKKSRLFLKVYSP